MGNKLEVGMKAPDFTLHTQKGDEVKLSELLSNKTVVLFFYPADYSPGCTAEACSFRDSYEVFQGAGAEVIGVSRGSTESQQGFTAKNRLPFLLHSDVDGKAGDLYGISKVFGILRQRVTFVIDRQGIIRHRFDSQINMDGHVQEALKVVQSLEAEAAK